MVLVLVPIFYTSYQNTNTYIFSFSYGTTKTTEWPVLKIGTTLYSTYYFFTF